MLTIRLDITLRVICYAICCLTLRDPVSAVKAIKIARTDSAEKVFLLLGIRHHLSLPALMNMVMPKNLKLE